MLSSHKAETLYLRPPLFPHAGKILMANNLKEGRFLLAQSFSPWLVGCAGLVLRWCSMPCVLASVSVNLTHAGVIWEAGTLNRKHPYQIGPVEKPVVHCLD